MHGVSSKSIDARKYGSAENQPNRDFFSLRTIVKRGGLRQPLSCLGQISLPAPCLPASLDPSALNLITFCSCCLPYYRESWQIKTFRHRSQVPAERASEKPFKFLQTQLVACTQRKLIDYIATHLFVSLCSLLSPVTTTNMRSHSSKYVDAISKATDNSR